MLHGLGVGKWGMDTDPTSSYHGQLKSIVLPQSVPSVFLQSPKGTNSAACIVIEIVWTVSKSAGLTVPALYLMEGEVGDREQGLAAGKEKAS